MYIEVTVTLRTMSEYRRLGELLAAFSTERDRADAEEERTLVEDDAATPAVAPVELLVEPELELVPEPALEVGTHTLTVAVPHATLVTAATRVAQAPGGVATLVGVLRTFGVARVDALPEARWPEFMAALEAA